MTNRGGDYQRWAAVIRDTARANPHQQCAQNAHGQPCGLTLDQTLGVHEWHDQLGDHFYLCDAHNSMTDADDTEYRGAQPDHRERTLWTPDGPWCAHPSHTA